MKWQVENTYNIICGKCRGNNLIIEFTDEHIGAFGSDCGYECMCECDHTFFINECAFDED